MNRTTVFSAAALAGVLAFAGAVRADAPAAEAFSVTTSDGVKIAGDYYAAASTNADEKPPFVMLLHMYKVDRKTWGPLVETLTADGISVVAIDMRGHGESTEVVGPPDGGETVEGDLAKRVDDRDKDVFKEMANDVEAAFTWVAESGKVDLSRFGIVGASIGCTVALDYVGMDPSVDVLVCLSPGEKYMGINSSTDIRKIEGRPIMMIATPEEREPLDELKKANDAAEIDVRMGIDGNRKIHGTDMLGKVENLERDISNYLKNKLGGGTPEEERVVTKLKGHVFYTPDAPQASRMEVGERRWLSNADEGTARGLRSSGGGPKTMTGRDDLAP